MLKSILMALVMLVPALGVAQVPCPYSIPSKCTDPTPSPTPTPTPAGWPPVPVQPDARHIPLPFVYYNYVGNGDGTSTGSPLVDKFPTNAVTATANFFAAFARYWAQNSYGHVLLEPGAAYGPSAAYTFPRPSGQTGCLNSPYLAALTTRMQADIPNFNTSQPWLLSPCVTSGPYTLSPEKGQWLYPSPRGVYSAIGKLNGYSGQYEGLLLNLPWDALGLACVHSGVKVPLALPSECQQTPRIGDPVGTKSGYHTAAQFKFNIGWLTASNRLVVTTPGTYHIAPLEVLSSGPMFIDVRLPGELSNYVGEYRLPIGPDSGLAGTKLVNAILWRQGNALVDMHPNDTTSKNHHGMIVGESLTLPLTTHKIIFKAATPTDAAIEIQ